MDDPFANFLGPGYKYWGALATACGLYPHIPHSDEPIEPVVAVNGLKALDILQNDRAKLDELAKYLHEKETITGEEFMRILNG